MMPRTLFDKIWRQHVVARRAERLMVELAASVAINPVALQYVNRLSDHLFQLGRRLNDQGAKDVLWVPGGNR